MFYSERQEELLSLLKKEKSMRVSSIAAKLFTSESTVRRDLTALEKEGLVRRTFGGAVICETERSDEPLVIRNTKNKKAKSEIACRAAELVREDAGFTASVEAVDAPATMLSENDTIRACAILACAPNGVLAMSREVSSLVEFSRNLGVGYTEDDVMTFGVSTRSGMESRLDASIAELDALARAVGCTSAHRGRYPGWAFAPVSPLREAYLEAYRAVTGEAAKVNVIHAGLECGIIYSRLPEMDIISIGPDLFDIHSPAEAMDLSSVEVFWQTLEASIRSL